MNFKRTIIISTMICLIVAMLCVLLIFCGINKQQLKGKIIMPNGFTGGPKGIVVFDPSSEEYEIILNEDRYLSMAYDEDRTKILLVKLVFRESEDYFIYEYDIQKQLLTPLSISYNYMYGSTFDLSDISYVPNGNMISYLWDRKLYTYNLDTNEESFIIDLVLHDTYSWDKDGRSFIFYSFETDMICKYYIESKKVEMLFEGSNPVYSNNKKLIAYYNDGLKIKEIETDKEWSYNGTADYFIFSEDDNYIVVGGTKNPQSKLPTIQKIVIWDYKNGTTKTITKEYDGIPDLDW